MRNNKFFFSCYVIDNRGRCLERCLKLFKTDIYKFNIIICYIILRNYSIIMFLQDDYWEVAKIK